MVTPEAGVTHDIVLGGVGFMLTGIPQRSDITSAIPRVSIGTEQRKHTDFSELDTFSQSSWHHGRGQEQTFDDPNAFQDSEHFVTWIPNKLIPSPAHKNTAKTGGSVVDFDGYASSMILYQGNLYMLLFGDTAATNALYIWDNTNSEWDTVAASLDTSSGEPNQLHVFNDDLFVAQGETVAMRRLSDSTWTDNTLPARFLATFGDNDTSYLWRADNLNELYHSSDPHLDGGATWVGPLKVGDTTYPIRGMVAGFQGALWVCKDDGLYAVTYDQTAAAFVVVQVIDLSDTIDSNNGKAMIEFGGNLFFSVSRTLYRYDGSSISIMGPNRGQPDPNQTNINDNFSAGSMGKVVGLSHDANLLYAALDSEGDHESRVLVWGGTGWHSAHESADTSAGRIRSVFYFPALATSDDLAYPTLWWSDDNSTTETIVQQQWGRFGQDPSQDTTIVYENVDSVLVTSWYDAGLPDVEKTFVDIILNFATPIPNASIGMKVEFQVDDFDTWYTAGQSPGPNNGTISIKLPDNYSTTPKDVEVGMTAKKIRYRITYTPDSPWFSVFTLRFWGHRFVVRPTARYGWNLVVKCYENLLLLDRSQETNTAEELRNSLYKFRDSRTPLVFRDGTELPTAKNRILDPSIGNDPNEVSHWDSINSATIVANGQYKVSGTFSLEVDCTSNDSVDRGVETNFAITFLANGASFIGYIEAWVPTDEPFYLQIYDDTNTTVRAEVLLSGSSSSDLSRFQKQKITWVNTTGDNAAIFLRIIRKAGEHGDNNTIFYIDNVEAYVSTDQENVWFTSTDSEQPQFFDGQSLRSRWSTPSSSLSTSNRRDSSFVYITGISESFRYPEGKSDSKLQNSEITISIREV